MSLLLLFSGARVASATYTGSGPGPIGTAATAVVPQRGSVKPIVPTAATASAPRPSR